MDFTACYSELAQKGALTSLTHRLTHRLFDSYRRFATYAQQLTSPTVTHRIFIIN